MSDENKYEYELQILADMEIPENPQQLLIAKIGKDKDGKRVEISNDAIEDIINDLEKGLSAVVTLLKFTGVKVIIDRDK